jgi:tRNA G18 (ribose-2'-O)-methylase SpoU
MTTRLPPDRAGTQLDEEQLLARQRRFVAEAKPSAGPAIVAIGMRTPENLGSILRHADAAGCRRVLFVDAAIQPAGKKLSRIARSADRHLRYSYLSSEELIHRLDELAPLVAVEITSRSVDLYHAALPGDCSLVVGSERAGISREILERCSLAVHIPMYGVNGSMNVSHALTLAMYEWRRQHG